jgi:hypothetical protein
MTEPSSVFAATRKRLLAVVPKSGAVRPSPDLQHVFGAVVDVGFNPLFTVAAFADGTVTVLDSGGNVIAGLGDMPEFRQRAHDLLAAVEGNLSRMAAVTRTPVPAFGRVRVTALTYNGRMGVDLPGEPLLSGLEPLSVVLLTSLAIIDKAQGVGKRSQAQVQPANKRPD